MAIQSECLKSHPHSSPYHQVGRLCESVRSLLPTSTPPRRGGLQYPRFHNAGVKVGPRAATAPNRLCLLRGVR